MEVKLIAMTDVVYNGKLAGIFLSPEQVCEHAARTCTSEDAGILRDIGYIEKDGFLVLGTGPLRAAIASGHESVLEHAVYTFEVKGVSRALTHQLVRHRMASYAQQSQRYVDMSEAAYIIPESIDKCLTPATPDGCPLNIEYVNAIRKCEEVYRKLVDAGISPEDARYVLPNACTTNIVLTANARELRHIFALRCCERAQKEIRELANKMLKICKEVSPTIFEDAGPSCVRDGFCRESKSCGRAPKLERVLEIMDEMDGEESIRDEQRTAERECHR